MEIGESVVFVNAVEGVEVGRHGRVMGLCDDTVMVGCRMRERLQCVLVHTWDVLPEPMWRRLLRRRQMGSCNEHGEHGAKARVDERGAPGRGGVAGDRVGGAAAAGSVCGGAREFGWPVAARALGRA